MLTFGLKDDMSYCPWKVQNLNHFHSHVYFLILVVEAGDGDWGTGAVPGISSKQICFYQNGVKNIDIKGGVPIIQMEI